MTEKPEGRGFIIENLILAWKKLGAIREIIKRLTERQVYKDLPDSVKEDIKAIKEEAQIRKEEK
jgi:hypothetical protein